MCYVMLIPTISNQPPIIYCLLPSALYSGGSPGCSSYTEGCCRRRPCRPGRRPPRGRRSPCSTARTCAPRASARARVAPWPPTKMRSASTLRSKRRCYAWLSAQRARRRRGRRRRGRRRRDRRRPHGCNCCCCCCCCCCSSSSS